MLKSYIISCDFFIKIDLIKTMSNEHKSDPKTKSDTISIDVRNVRNVRNVRDKEEVYKTMFMTLYNKVRGNWNTSWDSAVDVGNLIMHQDMDYL